MHKIAPALLLLSMILLSIGQAASLNDQTKVSVSTSPYQGWHQAIHISNRDVEVVVVPAIGRIMHFAETDKDNWLYINPEFKGLILADGKPRHENGQPVHTAFGGDRIWPMQESDFIAATGSFRPADFYIDGLPWQYEIIPNGLSMISPISAFTGIQIRRDITLAPTGSTLHIKQTMHKLSAPEPDAIKPLGMTIWNLTVLQSPEAITFEIANAALFEKDQGLLIPNWNGASNHAHDNILRNDNLVALLATGDDKFQKMGANGNGWIAGIRNGSALIEQFDYDPKASYPDGGTSTTTFMTSNIGELECLSPLAPLKVGESINFDLTWSIIPLKGKNLDRQMHEIKQWVEQ